MSKTWTAKQALATEIRRVNRVKREKAIERQRERDAEAAISETVHQLFSQRNYLSVYVYDPTEDGPECEIIRSILVSHSFGGELRNEHARA
jgi:hypothetical protein